MFRVRQQMGATQVCVGSALRNAGTGKILPRENPSRRRGGKRSIDWNGARRQAVAGSRAGLAERAIEEVTAIA